MDSRFTARFRSLVHDESGATAVEYAVMLMLIITVVIVAVRAIGGNVSQSFQTFLDTFNSAS